MRLGPDTSDHYAIRPWPEQPVAFAESVWNLDGPWHLGPGGAIAAGYDHEAARELARFADSRRDIKRLVFGEIYLTLQDLDLDDPAAILAWINEYGPMGLCWYQHPVSAESTYKAPAVDWLDDLQLPDDPAQRIVAQLHQAREEAMRANGATHPQAIVETLEEFRFCAALLRDLTLCWQALSRPLPDAFDLDELVEPPLHLKSPLVASLGGTDQDPRALGAAMLESYLEPLLAPFHPRLRMVEPGSGFSLRPIQANISLYHHLALELYNHIVERQAYRTCANETCGRLFVRQHGRAQHGQYRTSGVLYCSRSCARAQANRAYRRRRSGGPRHE